MTAQPPNLSISEERLQEVREEIARHMDEILCHFHDGARITVIVRGPGDMQSDMLLTNDDLREVARVVDRSQRRRAH